MSASAPRCLERAPETRRWPRTSSLPRSDALKFQAIIFDFDGVIVDSEAVANAAMAEILTARGHAVTGEEAVARYSGLRWIDCHKKIEEESGLSFDSDELGRAIDEAVAARTAEMLAIEGIEPFLAPHS